MNRNLFLLMLLLVGCIPVRVVSVGPLSPTAKDRHYVTYNFGEINMKDPAFGNFQKNLQFLTSAIDREMQARGFKRSAADPDLIINFGLGITEEVQTRETTIRDAPGHFQYSATGTTGRTYSWQSQEIEVARWKEGHLALDYVDREKNEMIWQSSVAGTLDKDEKKMKERIDKAIKDLYKKFPIKSN